MTTTCLQTSEIFKEKLCQQCNLPCKVAYGQKEGSKMFEKHFYMCPTYPGGDGFQGEAITLNSAPRGHSAPSQQVVQASNAAQLQRIEDELRVMHNQLNECLQFIQLHMQRPLGKRPREDEPYSQAY